MILIVGGGAVGTVLATYLGRAGRPVRLVIRPKDVARFEPAAALRTDRMGGGTSLTAAKPEITTALDLHDARYVLICVKAPDLDAVLDSLPRPLPANVTLVSTLNGVGALRRIRERFPQATAVSMTVMFNAQLLAPLHARITTRPVVLVGSDDPELLKLFGDSGMRVVPAEGESAAWGKLLINLANAVCGLTHTTFKDLLTRMDMRVIYAAVLEEAVTTMEAAGIRYRLPMPLPYRAYRQLLLRGGPLPWWLAKARNGLQDGSYPSMVSDLDQGRHTEVTQLNGEIVELGRRLGRPTPLNAAIVGLVRDIEGRPQPRYLTPGELRARLGL